MIKICSAWVNKPGWQNFCCAHLLKGNLGCTTQNVEPIAANSRITSVVDKTLLSSILKNWVKRIELIIVDLYHK